MCSINDYELEREANQNMKKSTYRVLTESDLCRKCQIKKADFILRDKDFYCMQCFTVYFVHKFRSTIGKSREIKHGDKVLVACSGGVSSTCLLHLIRQGLDESTTKKLQFHPHVLYVSESVLNNTHVSTEEINKQVKKLNFPFTYTNFEEILKEESEDITLRTIKETSENLSEETVPVRSEGISEFDRILNQKIKNQTSKEDFIRQLRYRLICRCAKQLGFRKVFLGCNGTQLAVDILSNVALGRGSQIADYVQFKSNHFGVKVFLPLRETFDDEIKFFIKCQNILVPNEGKILEENKPSIVSCTRTFIHNLQKEFFSTVPTVFRTGSKLVRSKDTDSKEEECVEKDLCSFCGLKLDTCNVSSSSALNSIKLSRKLTENHFMNGDDDGSSDQHTDNDEDKIYQYFCYGCTNLMLDLGYPNGIGRLHDLLNKNNHEKNFDIINRYLIED